MRSSAVSAGNTATAAQYNALRQDAAGGAFLLPHQQSAPDLTLKVEAGVCYVGATRVIYAGGNSPSFTAPASNPRIDLLTIDSSGTIGRTAGTEAASPSVPTYPSDKLVLAEVYCRVGQTALYDTDQGSHGYIKQDVRPVLGGSYIASAAQIADGVITDAKLASTDFIKQNCAQIYAADSQASDTYVITLSPAPGSLTTGMLVIFKANTANTGAATLNVNSLGAKTIKKNKDADLSDNDIKAGQIVQVVYDGTNFQMVSPVSNGGFSLFAIGQTTGTALDYASSTVTTITHSLGVIPKFIRIITSRFGAGSNNRPSVSHGIAKINSDGSIASQLCTQWSSASNYGGAEAVSGSAIAGICAASGAYQFGTLGSVGSSSMQVTFGGTGYGTLIPGGTITYQWEVWA